MPYKCKGCSRTILGFRGVPSHACTLKTQLPRKLQLLVNAAKTAGSDPQVQVFLRTHAPSENMPLLEEIRRIAAAREILVDWHFEEKDYEKVSPFG